jgi:hypothetical protein
MRATYCAHPTHVDVIPPIPLKTNSEAAYSTVFFCFLFTMFLRYNSPFSILCSNTLNLRPFCREQAQFLTHVIQQTAFQVYKEILEGYLLLLQAEAGPC